jgi:hypothetical protein
MKCWFDEVREEINQKYGKEVGEKLSNILSDLVDDGKVHEVNKLLGNLLDRDYKKDYK